MKFLLQRRVALLAALGVSLFLVPVTRAQNPDSIRVVRLSRAEGQVLVLHQGSNVWEEAQVNLPLQEGDSLATQGGFAEIEFENGATGYLAGNSVLEFTQLGFAGGGRATVLTLTQGAGTFYADLASEDSFHVRTLTFDVAIPERAEFRADGFQDGAAAEVFVGSITVSTSSGSTTLDKGQSVAVHLSDLNDLSVGSLPATEDAFDQLVTDEGERIRSGNQNTLSYVPTPNVYGLSDLAIYGTWLNIPGVGYSWRPFSVGLSFTPFFNGRWVLDPRLGWIWVSNEAWGWTPYHFGNWLLSPVVGWVWVPGSPGGLIQWDPARVNWVQAGNQVGWVAKSPNDRDGAAANIKQGVVTRSLQSLGNGNATNSLLTGKELRNAAPLKRPTQEFAAFSEPGASGATRPGTRSTIRVAPWTLNNNSSIILDPNTHTFINRDKGAEVENKINVPVAPASVMPPPNPQAGIPRVTIPLTNSMNSRTNRVNLPSPYPTFPASRVNGPPTVVLPSGAPPARPVPILIPRPNVPQPATPRPRAPSQPPIAHPAAQPTLGSRPAEASRPSAIPQPR